MIIPLIALLVGVAAGRLWLPAGWMDSVNLLITISLSVVVFAAGVDVGEKKLVFRKLAEYRAKILLIPIGTVIGSVVFGSLLGILLGIPLNEAAAVSAGFGYYSLSAGILSDLAGANLGALAFLANICREVLALVSIPFFARYASYYTAIAPSGATSMDTTLGVISASTNEETTVIAMFNGVLLTALVPVLVPLLYRCFPA